MPPSLPVPPHPARPPRRFRWRLLAALLLCGLGPLLAGGWLGGSLLEEALSLTPPIAPVLARASAALEARAGTQDPHAGAAHESPEALVAELRAAELGVVQAELLRQGLLGRGRRHFAFALAGTALLVAGAAVVLGRRLARPLERLTGAMARYARGDLGHQVPVAPAGGDELDFLGRQLNAMGTELQAQRARLQTTETIAAWRDVARAMAHDLKNPLTAMRMALGRLARPGRTEEAVQESVSLLQDELAVLMRMTQSFSDFARLPRPTFRALDLRPLVEDVASLYREQAGATAIAVEEGGPVPIHGDPDQLRRALGNLVKNAVEASNGAGAVVLSLTAGADHAVVRVRDHGAGLGEAIAGDALMRGLASTKAAGRGLGLPIAHTVVHAHGGQLRLLPRAPGVEAEVVLPLVAPDAGGLGARS
jgi:nitrogen fixation/metabolism regulation signal transduction histidine kinase